MSQIIWSLGWSKGPFPGGASGAKIVTHSNTPRTNNAKMNTASWKSRIGCEQSF
jgi:hypothetical protein